MKNVNRHVMVLTDVIAKGGVGRAVSYLTSGLVQHFRVTTVVYDSRRIDFDYEGRLCTLNITPPPYENVVSEVEACLKGLIRLRKLKKKNEGMVTISFKEHPNLINILSGRSKTIISVREMKSAGIRFQTEPLASFVKLLLKVLYNRADKVVCVSRGVADDLITKFGVSKEIVKVIYNPVDTNKIIEMSKEPLDIKERNLFADDVIISVGRLEREKGQ